MKIWSVEESADIKATESTGSTSSNVIFIVITRRYYLFGVQVGSFVRYEMQSDFWSRMR